VKPLLIAAALVLSAATAVSAGEAAEPPEAAPAAAAPPADVRMPDGYYKPLDGRFAFGVRFPLVNTYTVANNPGILAGTPFADAKDGFTVIEAVTNGEPADAFIDEDVGKEFVLLWGHKNPGRVDYDRVDEYAPLETTSRYSRVVHRISPSRLIVDFAYNGGDAARPVDLKNWKARIFRDSSADWAAFGKELNREDTADIGRLEEYRLHASGHYRLHAYELKSFDALPITRAARVLIHAGGPDKYALVKIGVEDHYLLEAGEGTRIYKRPAAIFSVENGAHSFICQNLIFSPVHRQHNAGAIHGIRVLTSAANKPAGVMAVIGCRTYTEFNQIGDLANGAAGMTRELPALASVTNGRCGTYGGEGLARRAVTFATNAFVNCDFMGGSCFGASTASGDGCNMVYIDCTGDYSPQVKWGKVVNDYAGYVASDPSAYDRAPEPLRRARADGWYPTDVVLPKTDVNMLSGLALGGSNRFNITNIDRFIFLKNTPGNSNLAGYYNICYNRSGKALPTNEAKGKRFIAQDMFGFNSATYDILQHEVPRTGKRYVISRHYSLSTKTLDWLGKNGTGSSGGGLFSLITNYNNPMATVWVDNPDGFSAGDTVTSEGITKRVVEVAGNELRVTDKTGSYMAGKTVTNGRATATVKKYEFRCEYGYPAKLYPFAIRMDACWSTIFQCYAHELDPLQVPAKGRGVAIQPGDQFRILPFLLVRLEGKFPDVDKVRGAITGSRSGASAHIGSFLRTYDPDRTQEENGKNPYYQVNLADLQGVFAHDETVTLTDGETRAAAVVVRVSTHDPAAVHTARGLERVAFPECPAEFVWARHRSDTPHNRTDMQSYYTFYDVCERELPADLPLTMEIEIVKSNAEYLLDPGTTAKIRQKYISNGHVGGRPVYTWPSKNQLWQETSAWGSGCMGAEGGDVAGHFAYSQVHHYWYFLRTDFHGGFWRQNYFKPPMQTITLQGQDYAVAPLFTYSRGHVLINCRRPLVGQFSKGDEGSQNFDRRRLLEDYLAAKGEIEPVPEAKRAKLMSFGGDAKANPGYTHSYVREETAEEAPPPPEELLDALKSVGIEVLPFDRKTETVEDRYTGKMAQE